MDDLISRQAALDMIHSTFSKSLARQRAEECINKVPAVQAARKKGKWLISGFTSDAKCSECGMYFRDVYDIESSDKYCRHCGAQMEGLKVVDDE